MKVIITDQWFHHSGKHYTRGDTADIEPEYFDASRMKKVEEPKPVENLVQQTVVVMETAKSEIDTTEEVHAIADKIVNADGCCGNVQ